MAKFPEPPSPADLAKRTAPEVKTVDAGTSLSRVYFRGGPHPTTWRQFRAYGPVPSGRFDHHQPPPRRKERAILYAAIEAPTCLAEVFQETTGIPGYRVTLNVSDPNGQANTALAEEVERELDEFRALGVPVLDGVVCALILATGFAQYGVGTSKVLGYNPEY